MLAVRDGIAFRCLASITESSDDKVYIVKNGNVLVIRRG